MDARWQDKLTLPIVRLSAVALYLGQRLAWIISRHLQHSLPTNTPSPPLGMIAIHTRVFTEHLPTWTILTAAGHATGPEISESQWLNCVLHCRWTTCTASDVETQPLVHIAMVLTRRQNIWCYTFPAHDQARRESWPNLHYQSNPRRLWSFLEKIGAVTRPPGPGMRGERETI